MYLPQHLKKVTQTRNLVLVDMMGATPESVGAVRDALGAMYSVTDVQVYNGDTVEAAFAWPVAATAAASYFTALLDRA